MADQADVDARGRRTDLFFPTAPDAVRMCLGPCGEAKPIAAFPNVRGRSGARVGECRECRDARLSASSSAAPGVVEGGTKGLAEGGRRAKARAQRQLIGEAVLEVVIAHSGTAVTVNQVYEEVFDRLEIVPPEKDVRDSLRTLAKADSRFAKVGRDAYAWTPGGVIPPPPMPAHVTDMVDRRWRGETLDEIGAVHGVTRERVRQLLKKYGGPSVQQVRDLRAAEALAAQHDHEKAVAAAVRGVLEARGPMTVSEVIEATGAEANDISRFWPHELAHLRLHATGNHEIQWSDSAILDAIREAALYEFPLTANAYSDLVAQGQVEGPSMARIGQRFRSWTAACEAAGVVTGQTMRPHYESRWSDKDLLQIARRYLLDPDSPNSANRFDEWKRAFAPDGPSFQTLRNRFGSWTEVKRRALARGDVLG